jgi:hypothetical protein
MRVDRSRNRGHGGVGETTRAESARLEPQEESGQDQTCEPESTYRRGGASGAAVRLQANVALTTETAAALPLRQVGVADLLVEPQLGGLVRLEPEVGDVLRLRLGKALAERVGIDGGAESWRVEANRRWGATVETGEVLPELSQLGRLMTWGSKTDAYFDPASGRVLFSEGLGELPQTVERPDPVLASPLLKAMFSAPLKGPDRVYLDALAGGVPLSALQLAAAAGVRIDVAPLSDFGPTVNARFGPAAGHRPQSDAQRLAGAHGVYEVMANVVQLKPASARQRATAATFAVHEFAHALAYALGSEGVPFSASAEWRQLFQETKNADPEKGPRFPTPYAATDEEEFFAEAATVFLRRHVVELGSANLVLTRERLKRDNPRAYEILERIFSKDIPEALASGRFQTGGGAATRWRLSIAATEAIAPEDRTGAQWYQLGNELNLLGLSDRDVSSIERARQVTQQALGDHADALDVASAMQLLELEGEITASQRWLEDPATS